MEQIPLSALPAQSLIVILDDQNVGLSVYQRHDRLFMDVSLDETPVATGCICLNLAPVIQQTTDFRGVLVFVDTQGDAPPQWDELGDGGRFVLLYLTDEEAAAYDLI